MRSNPLFFGASTQPNEIANLALWFDTNTIATLYQDSALTTPVTANNDPVGGWKDRSGNNYHGLQATAGARPLYKTNTLNGLPSILFDGTDDYLDLTGSAAGLVRNLAGFTIILVWNAAATPSQYLFAAQTALSTGRVAIIIDQATASQLSAGGRRLDADAFAQIVSTGLTATWYQSQAKYDYAGALVSQRVNGAANPATAAFQTAGSTSDTASALVSLGCFAPTNQHLVGSIAEVIAYSRALTSGEQNQIDLYLRDKYKIY